MRRLNREIVVRGTTWVFDIAFIDKQTGLSKDCTGLDSIIVLKRHDLAFAEEVISKYITWEESDPTQGAGFFVFNPDDTKNISPYRYFYEVYLFDPDGSYNESISKGIMKVESTLQKDVIPR